MLKYAVSISALICACGGAVAQDAPIAVTSSAEDAESEKTLDQIIVVGSKLGLTVQEADVSVEVFDQARIEREALFELDDVIQRTPNVNLNGNTSTLTIRGIARDGVSNGGQGVTSNIYSDGAPIATSALSFGFESLWDVQQVEVLRGPQSTVQGRNALAGAIVISTNDPTYDWELKGRARYAEFDTQQYSGVVSGPIIEDQLAFRVAVDYQSTDGITDSAIINEDADFADALLVRSKLLAEPNFLPDLRAELIFEYIDTDTGSSNSIVNAGVPITDPAFVDFDPFDRLDFDDFETNEAEVFRGIIDLSYDLTDNIQIKSLTTLEDVERARVLGDLDDLSIFLQNGTNDDSTETYSTELSVNYDFGRWSGHFGGYYFRSDEDFFFSVLTPLAAVAGGIPIDPADSLISADLDTVTETENFAFYAQTRFDLNEKWTFAFGIRYDREEFFTTGAQTTVSLLEPSCTATAPGFLVGAPLPFVTVPCAALLPAPAATPDQGNTFDAVLPRGSITYNITEDHSVFVAAQRGYRAGGTFVQISGIDTTVGGFEPEFLTNVEVGFRFQWLDRRLTVNGNIFYSRLDDQQVQLPGPTGGALDFFTDNIGATDIYGLELSFDYRPTDELMFFGSLGLLDTEFDDLPFGPELRALPDDLLLGFGAAGIAPPAPTPNPFANLAGNEAALAPNVSFTLGASYEHRSGLFADASVNFTGESESGVENLSSELIQAEIARINAASALLGVPPISVPLDFDEQSDSRTLVNARLGYKHENFTLSVFATNLFDDDATLLQNGINIEPDGNPLFLDTPVFTVNQPQTFGVQLDVVF